MSLILDGSNGLTFPNSTTQASAGQVLQVIQVTAATAVAVASGTYTDIGLSATITPKFSTSKVLIMSSVVADMTRSAPAQGGGTRIVRNSTAIWTPNPNGSSQPYTYYTDYAGTSATSMELTVLMNLQYLDSPATTSATTYKIQGAVYSTNNGGQVAFMPANAPANIILMEIAG